MFPICRGENLRIKSFSSLGKKKKLHFLCLRHKVAEAFFLVKCRPIELFSLKSISKSLEFTFIEVTVQSRRKFVQLYVEKSEIRLLL